MSKSKGVHIFDRFVWVWDNSHDVVVARMVEEALATGEVDPSVVESWRVCASIPDLAFRYPEDGGPDPTALLGLIDGARDAIIRHGNMTAEYLATWSVLEAERVSGGFLRSDILRVEALLDVVDGFDHLVNRTFPHDPPGSTWFLGAPTGRQQIPKRPS